MFVEYITPVIPCQDNKACCESFNEGIVVLVYVFSIFTHVYLVRGIKFHLVSK